MLATKSPPHYTWITHDSTRDFSSTYLFIHWFILSMPITGIILNKLSREISKSKSGVAQIYLHYNFMQLVKLVKVFSPLQMI
jgi:hypothetical protein